MGKRVWILLLTALLLVAVAGLSLLPTQDKFALHLQGRLHPWVHLLAFAGLSFLLTLAVRAPALRVAVVFCMIGFGYGTEFAEHLLDTWPVESTDVLLDGAGVLLGTAAAALWGRSARRSEPEDSGNPR
jgi:hypothetical protein